MKPRARKHQPQPATTSMFEWAMTLEQQREKEPVSVPRRPQKTGGFEFHPRAVAASSTRWSPPGDLAPSRRIGPERSLRPTGAPSRAGQIVPGLALDAPVGEDVAPAQVVSQLHQRLPVLGSWAGPCFCPSPHGVAMGL